jgi:hypothetical protein
MDFAMCPLEAAGTLLNSSESMVAIFLFSATNRPGLYPIGLLVGGGGAVKHLENSGKLQNSSLFKVYNALCFVHTRLMKQHQLVFPFVVYFNESCFD